METHKTDEELLNDCKIHLEYGLCDLPTPIYEDFKELLNRFGEYIELDYK